MFLEVKVIIGGMVLKPKEFGNINPKPPYVDYYLAPSSSKCSSFNPLHITYFRLAKKGFSIILGIMRAQGSFISKNVMWKGGEIESPQHQCRLDSFVSF